MLVMECPQVAAAGRRRLVGERRIVAMASALDGFVLTVRCPCGERHDVRIGRAPR